MYLGALGVAVAGLVIDMILPGPATASAAGDPSGSSLLVSGDAASLQGGAPGSTVAKASLMPSRDSAKHEALMRVVQRLRSVGEECDSKFTDMHDPVAPLATLSPEPLAAEPVFEAETAGLAAVPTPQVKEPSLQITSIMNAAGGRIAYINGRMFREGDTIDGWTIRKIHERSVDLEHAGLVANYTLDPR
jgi:hypothetical protein